MTAVAGLAKAGAAIVFLSSLAGCAHAPQPKPTYALVYPSSTPVCDIKRQREKYFGRTLVLEGTYRTDSEHYSFLEDPRCNDHGIISIDGDHPTRDDSVDTFNTQNETRCGNRGGLCVYAMHVAFEAEVVRGEAGHLGLGEGAPALLLRRVLFSRDLRK
jgi:hypothetical protein